MISAAVLGSTGYVGTELVYILSKKRNVKIKYLGSENSKNINIKSFDSRIKKKLPLIKLNSDFDDLNIDVLFLALPHTVSQLYVKKFYDKIKIIDLSADFRLTNKSVYNKTYQTTHLCPELINKFVYGLYDINFDLIKKSKNVAIPGCYPTSILLPLIPLLKKNIINTSSLIIDSKSGYSGAGKKFNIKNIFKKNNDNNFYNYNTNCHRHITEIQQELERYTSSKIRFSFNPHILPIFRGMMSTIYCDLKSNFSIRKISNYLKHYYKNHDGIEIIQDDKRVDFFRVQNTNKCLIKIFKHHSPSKIIIVSLIDNLQKGAAGQAVQCMSVMFKK